MPLTCIHNALINRISIRVTLSRVQSHVHYCVASRWLSTYGINENVLSLSNSPLIVSDFHFFFHSFSLSCRHHKLGNFWIPLAAHRREKSQKLVQLTSRVRIKVDYCRNISTPQKFSCLRILIESTHYTRWICHMCTHRVCVCLFWPNSNQSKQMGSFSQF